MQIVIVQKIAAKKIVFTTKCVSAIYKWLKKIHRTEFLRYMKYYTTKSGFTT